MGRSHEETHEALIANLRQIPERLQEEVNNGTIGLSPKSTNNSRLVVLPEHINPLCSEGSVLKETGECGKLRELFNIASHVKDTSMFCMQVTVLTFSIYLPKLLKRINLLNI